ncbi:MAG: ASKHA domain-containing protein, partial [Spirochaetaceae bacterium]|nr:ASKHA domain-containing protein [Spirochaetaceae bacterium]
MTRLAIAMDLGTSGYRAQAIDLENGKVAATAMTARHPLPGGNLMDHLHFALELGSERASRIVIEAVNRVIRGLGAPREAIECLAVCGNPAQLSLFRGQDIRDLAFSGTRMLASLGVAAPDRGAALITARDLGGLELPPKCRIALPPAVRGEIGADALALIVMSGIMDREETAIATDFGANAEMALWHRGRLHTGSTAAGPALEGQQLSCGMLAAPGAISGLAPARRGLHRLLLLDGNLLPTLGPVVDLSGERPGEPGSGPRPAGITGTGTIALIKAALETGLIELPRIKTRDRRL